MIVHAIVYVIHPSSSLLSVNLSTITYLLQAQCSDSVRFSNCTFFNFLPHSCESVISFLILLKVFQEVIFFSQNFRLLCFIELLYSKQFMLHWIKSPCIISYQMGLLLKLVCKQLVDRTTTREVI